MSPNQQNQEHRPSSKIQDLRQQACRNSRRKRTTSGLGHFPFTKSTLQPTTCSGQRRGPSLTFARTVLIFVKHISYLIAPVCPRADRRTLKRPFPYWFVLRRPVQDSWPREVWKIDMLPQTRSSGYPKPALTGKHSEHCHRLLYIHL